MYGGPCPKSINKDWPSHSYEYITCLVSGNSKKSILNTHLKIYGYTRQTYIEKFPGAPLISENSRNNYKKSASSEKGKSIRSNNMFNLNVNDTAFQEKRKAKVKEFLNSERSTEYRINASNKAKKQHKETNLSSKVSEYFKTNYVNSLDQKNRSTRMTGKNNIVHLPGIKEKIKKTYIENSIKGLNSSETRYKKRKYKNTNLIYQSTYELDFLNICNKHKLLDKIKNCHCFSSSTYPYNYYEPDFLLNDNVVIEIKSSYIEHLQEKKCPGLLNLKKELIESNGYKFLYIKDKNYSEFLNHVGICPS